MSATGLFRWLTLLALLFAPLTMIGGGPAMAHDQTVAAGHCADSDKPAEAPTSAPVDCMIACAGCLPTQSGAPSARLPLEAAARSAPLAFGLRGLHPEAATPPPRSS
jgi:hypothetical protein